MHPEDYDQNKAEADHLIYEADKNGDKKLTKQEVLDSYTIFVSSQATDFGQDLHYHHDELWTVFIFTITFDIFYLNFTASNVYII